MIRHPPPTARQFWQIVTGGNAFAVTSNPKPEWDADFDILKTSARRPSTPKTPMGDRSNGADHDMQELYIFL